MKMIHKLQRNTCAGSTVSLKAAIAGTRKATDDVSTRRISATVCDVLSTLVDIYSIIDQLVYIDTCVVCKMTTSYGGLFQILVSNCRF